MKKKVLKRKNFDFQDERHLKMIKYLMAISYRGCNSESAAMRIIFDVVCDDPSLLNDDGQIDHAENFKKFCSIDS